MLPQWIIEKKRDGHQLTDADIDLFIRDYVSGAIPDYQMAALAMAITLQGMSAEEIVALTRSMLHSGNILNTAALGKSRHAQRVPRIDKHSTGGVGDKISLILAPLAACCGLVVPMIAGRGLGLTGGTIDKLESIPGYRAQLDEAAFLKVLNTCGCSIISAMDTLVPADKKLYALRDVTGTVSAIPLIVASILSKKLAVQPDGLVLDVKWGRGAFMAKRAQGEALARTLVATAQRLGLNTRALLTDMNQPLGRSVGNALEVIESLEVLQGRGPSDVIMLTLELGARMLILGHVAKDWQQALSQLRAKLASGEAFERFKNMARLHGGDPRALDPPSPRLGSGLRRGRGGPARLPVAAASVPLKARQSGYIQKVDAAAIGRAVALLGAGRARITDAIDPAAGISALKKVGEPVSAGEALAWLHTNRPGQLAEARAFVKAAFQIVPERVAPPKLIALEIKETTK
ncbi:MAG: thymidine phosphorylase [Lentisphaerae bacterium]|nr:thymidine phosphorylase [Lentisphaerota bacterium]